MTVLEDSELNVVDDRMALMAIQVSSLDEASTEQKRRAMEFAEATSVSFSYKKLSRVDYLAPFRDLTKLQLDNNALTKIEGLDHLVHLRWLDLSFNALAKMENLEALVKLEDLSLYHNQIDTIEGLESCKDTLVSLSVGENKIKHLESFDPLRALTALRLANFAGNPVCDEEDYAPYVLTRTRELKYLDHRLVRREAVEKARDQYADELAELEAKEEEARVAKRKAAEKSARDAKAREANLLGVADLFDDMLSKDPEFPKLRKLPSEKDGGALTKGLLVFRETFERLLEEFTRAMERQLAAKNEETSEWRSVLDGALAEKDAEARALMRRLETERKHAFRALEKDEQTYGHPEDPDLEHAEETRAATRAENEANAKRVKAVIRAARAAARAERARSASGADDEGEGGVADDSSASESESESESDSDSDPEPEYDSDAGSLQSESEIDVHESAGRWLRQRGDETKEKLLAIELHCADFTADLIFEFDRNFSEIVDKSKQLIAGIFTEMRAHEEAYFAEMSEASTAMLEQFSTGKLDDVCDEDAKVVLADKDTFMNAVRAHHDFHVNMIDQREDALGSEERKRLDAVMAELRVWERERNRSRVEEILGQWKRHNDLVAEVCGDEEEEDEDEDEEDEGARREED